MKKYQLWLERKTYTQHLDNLIRIRMAASERKEGGKINKQQQKVKNLSRYQSQMKLNSSHNGQELSYIITARELQNHKMRLVRSRQIVRQNEQMVKRINKAKPFIVNSQPIDYANYKLKRVRQRSNVENSFSQTHKHFHNFAKMHHQVGDSSHKYQLVLNLLDVQMRMPQRSAQIMLEIIGNQSLAKSEFVSPEALRGHNFKFTFEDKIPDFFTLRIHSFKGLEDTVLGDYIIARPLQGQTVQAEWPTVASPGVLKGRVAYTRLLPKFWPIKRFK